jgi:hypothetical protein
MDPDANLCTFGETSCSSHHKECTDVNIPRGPDFRVVPGELAKKPQSMEPASLLRHGLSWSMRQCCEW